MLEAETRRPSVLRAWLDDAPPAFVVAVVVTVVTGAVFGLISAHGIGQMERGNIAEANGWTYEFWRWSRQLLSPGVALATAMLMVIGFGELVRRAGPGTDGLVLRVGWVASIVVLVTVLAGLYFNNWWLPRAKVEDLRETLEEFWLWHMRVTGGAALVASGALLVAGRRILLVQGMAMPLIIATAFAYPTRMVWELIHDRGAMQDERWTTAFVEIGIDVGFAAALLAVVAAIGRALPPAPVDLSRAGEGLQRVGSALVARVLVLVVAAFTMVSTFASTSLGLRKVTLIVFPLGLLIASIALVTGMMQAGGLAAPGAPRKRFYMAGVLTTIALVVEALKALALYTNLPSQRESWTYYGDNAKRVINALPYLTPTIALSGLLCLLSGVHALRRWVPDSRVDERAIMSAAVAVSVFMAAGVAVLRWGASSPRDLGTFVLVGILVAIFNVTAQLAVARACHRTAEAMRDAPALPTAVVAIKS